MNVVAPQRIVSTPTVTFSTLAKVMGPLSPMALASKLRRHKYPTPGPRLSYIAALNQAQAHLISGTPLHASVSTLRPHEQDAVAALAAMGIALPLGYTAARPTPPSAHGWTLNGVEISVFPDLVLSGPNGSTGAAKFSFTKDPLPRGVGTTMAAVLWHHRANIVGIQNVNPAACIVYEPRIGATFRPGANPVGQIQNTALACQVIAAVWPTL